MQPKKSLGQHWLFDEEALRAVADAGEITGSDTVVEVGPGLGSLTRLLCERAGRVIAVEADPVLASNLHNELRRGRTSAQKLEVVEGDILQFDFNGLPAGYKVVANIPYYITSNLLRQLLESDNPPTVMALLLQAEVADRVTASPGDMSVLAFSVQYYAEARKFRTVPKELFDPVPKVDSAILQLKKRPQPYFPADKKKLFRLVKAGFGERRKQLRNSLAGGLRLDKDQTLSLLATAGISPDSRAQELSLKDWGALYAAAENML